MLLFILYLRQAQSIHLENDPDEYGRGDSIEQRKQSAKVNEFGDDSSVQDNGIYNFICITCNVLGTLNVQLDIIVRVITRQEKNSRYNSRIMSEFSKRIFYKQKIKKDLAIGARSFIFLLKIFSGQRHHIEKGQQLYVQFRQYRHLQSREIQK